MNNLATHEVNNGTSSSRESSSDSSHAPRQTTVDDDSEDDEDDNGEPEDGTDMDMEDEGPSTRLRTGTRSTGRLATTTAGKRKRRAHA